MLDDDHEDTPETITEPVTLTVETEPAEPVAEPEITAVAVIEEVPEPIQEDEPEWLQAMTIQNTRTDMILTDLRQEMNDRLAQIENRLPPVSTSPNEPENPPASGIVTAPKSKQEARKRRVNSLKRHLRR